MKIRLQTFLCLSFFAVNSFGQSIISINFVGGGAVGGTPMALAPGEFAGVVPATNWNNLAQNLASGTAANLRDSLGMLTPVSVFWSSDNTWSTVIAQANANLKMMKGYLDNPSHDITVSVIGVPYTNYDVYIYFTDDNTTTGTIGSYSIGANTFFGKDSGILFNGTFVEAHGTNASDPNAVGNYLIFRGLSSSTFTLKAHAEYLRSPVNGLQIVPTSSGGTRQPVIVGWGNDNIGQIGHWSGLSNVVAISASQSSLGLRGNGTASGSPIPAATSPPLGLSNVVAIAKGQSHGLALKDNGTVVAWGYNTWGETNVPTGLSSVIAIAAGTGHCLALKSNGTVVAWGYNLYGQTNVPAGLSDVVGIAAGGSLSLALKRSGTVVAWGYSCCGLTNVPVDLSNVAAIATGGNSSFAVKSDGTVVSWPDPSEVPSGLSNVVTIAANADHKVALKNDGTVIAWGNNQYGQTNVLPGLSNVTAVAAGDNFSLGLTYNPPLPPPSPTNDQCIGAIQMTTSAVYTVNTAWATSTGDPPSCASLAKGVWYKFTPTSNSQITVSTSGSDFQTSLSVLTGTCGSLSEIGCNYDNFYPHQGANVSFNALAGVTHWILAGGTDGQVGNLSIIASLTPAPLNDMCSGSVTLTNGTDYSLTTQYATSTGDPSPACGFSVGKGVWFTYTPSVDGTVTVTTSADFQTVVDVYPGACNSLSSISCNYSSTTFFGTANTTYKIFVGGDNGTGGNLSVRATVCAAPRFISVTNISFSVEADGIRVFYHASFSGTGPLTYEWRFYDSSFDELFSINPGSDTVDHLFGPFDEFPASLNVIARNNCGFNGGNGSPTPSCGAICLSIGAPNTQAGTSGSGTNYFYTNACGTFGSGSRWFYITTTNVPGMYTVSTEGSSYNTAFAVYRANAPSSRNSLALVACTNNAPGQTNRLQFETRPNTNYWLVVNPPPGGANLNLTYGYELRIASLAFNKTNRTVDLRSAALPSLQKPYSLLVSTNLTTGAGSWSALVNTNFSANTISSSNNILRFLDTNVPTLNRRFYRIQIGP